MMDFQQAIAEFQQLKQQFDSGQLAEADFKTKLQDLMVQDEQGRWWMIGRETGQWYRHDGADWVRADPPVASPRPSMAARAPARTRARPGWIAVLWITLGWALGAGAVALFLFLVGANRQYFEHRPLAQLILWADFFDKVVPASISMLVLGAPAGLITALALRTQGVLSSWKGVLLVTLGWVLCMALFPFYPRTLPLAGALGGLAMALILHFTGALSDWKDLLWIALSWAVPWLPSAFIPRGSLGSSILLFVAGAALAAFNLVWRLRVANRPER